MKYQQKVAAEAKLRRKRLRYLVENGHKATDIAASMGISKQRVSQLLKLARAE